MAGVREHGHGKVALPRRPTLGRALGAFERSRFWRAGMVSTAIHTAIHTAISTAIKTAVDPRWRLRGDTTADLGATTDRMGDTTANRAFVRCHRPRSDAVR